MEPPYVPIHCHTHGPAPVTAAGVAFPAAHNHAALHAIALPKVPPSAGPHTPFVFCGAPFLAIQLTNVGAEVL